jgi:hypothetical protein
MARWKARPAKRPVPKHPETEDERAALRAELRALADRPLRDIRRPICQPRS